MADELRAGGFDVSRPRVATLMRKNGIRAVHAKKFVVTTDSKHRYSVAENKLDRDFSARENGQGLALPDRCPGLFDRKGFGWSQSDDLCAEKTTVAAWKMAVVNRPPSKKLIFHSDRGIPYACHDFADLLESYKCVERSMSGKGTVGTMPWPRASSRP